MAWAKLDDRFHEHRKVRRVWRACPAAVGLHVMAITYCAGHETDGFIDRDFVEEKLPNRRDRDRALDALVEAGLWEPTDDGWTLHDFLDYHPSRAEAEAQRAELSVKRAEAGRKGGLARAAKANAKQTSSTLPASNVANPSPVPSRPVANPPSPPRGGRARDDVKYQQDMNQYCQRVWPEVPVNESRSVAGWAIKDVERAGQDPTDERVRAAGLRRLGITHEQEQAA